MASTQQILGSAGGEESSLPAERVREIILVRAFEESDREGRLLPVAVRNRATTDAQNSNPDGSGRRVIGDRASRLMAVLVEKFPMLNVGSNSTASVSAGSPLLAIIAFLLGLSLNALGPERRINALSFPLLFVIAWNLLVYVALLVDRLRGARETRSWRTPFSALCAWFNAPDRWWGRVAAGFKHEQSVANAFRQFASSWWRVGRPLHRARMERGFHAASALVAIGTVAGMYVRGLALSYELVWESTFLSHASVQTLVSTVLWPADQLLKFGTTLGAAGETSPAAPWIHLYALTAVLFVVAPRALLFVFASLRTRKLERSFPFDLESDGYFLRLLASDRGQGVHVAVQPYSYKPTKFTEEGLLALLLDVFGNRAHLDLKSGLEYGIEWSELGFELGSDSVVLLFNAAQSPEQEVHGHFLEGGRAALDCGDSAARVLVLVDETSYRERLGADSEGERRLGERRRAWERLAREAGFRCAFISLAQPAQNEDLDALRAAVESTDEAFAR